MIFCGIFLFAKNSLNVQDTKYYHVSAFFVFTKLRKILKAIQFPDILQYDTSSADNKENNFCIHTRLNCNCMHAARKQMS